MTKPKKALITFGVVALLLGSCFSFVLYPALRRAQCGAEMFYVWTQMRGQYQIILKLFDETGEIPPTYHLLINESVFFYPTITHPRCGSERLDGYRYGELKCADILAGRVPAERIRETALALGTASQSWEFLPAAWLTRDPEVLRGKDPRVIACVARVERELDQVAVIVAFADGHIEHLLASDPDRIIEMLERDDEARLEHGLAPFPHEIDSWLLNGEPASVGEGTIVPPKLADYVNMSDDESP